MNAFVHHPAGMAESTTARALAPQFPWMTRDEVFRIETPRLWLRWSRPADADRLQAIAGLREVAEMTATWPHPLPAGEAAKRIDIARLLNAAGNALVLAITVKGEPDRLIGQIGCNVLPSEQMGIGYMIDPGIAGRGLASEALGYFVRVLFTHTRIGQIAASSRVINPASRRVLEKNGFGYLRTSNVDTSASGAVEVDFFTLSRRAWKLHVEDGREVLGRAAVDHRPVSFDISEGRTGKIPSEKD